ncbi:MAG: peptidylprolyl isomerase, partial [Candidatus Nanoarchaeia archaeon]|nr:peptidylprolyl isomerase [Candidatus Nanoarchaeia archaeon]
MKVEKNSIVHLSYEGKLEDGTVFDSTDETKPLIAQLGENQLIKGFEDAIIGLSLNDEKEFKIESSKAYGKYDENLVQKVAKEQLLGDIELEVGKELILTTEQFPQPIRAKIKSINDEIVELDFNHPLAGQNLIFKIKVL